MHARVDQTALRFNQACIILLLIMAYLLNQPWLAVFVGMVMAVGTLWPRAGLFKQIYARIARPLGVLRPTVVADDPAPHLFAQGLGALVLGGAAAAFLFGIAPVGWALVGLVVVLAGINLIAGFCLGCFVYYQLARRGVTPALPKWQPAPARVDQGDRRS